MHLIFCLGRRLKCLKNIFQAFQAAIITDLFFYQTKKHFDLVFR